MILIFADATAVTVDVGHARLRETARERDAAVYEAKRSAERGSAAEAWRLKELKRAEA